MIVQKTVIKIITINFKFTTITNIVTIDKMTSIGVLNDEKDLCDKIIEYKKKIGADYDDWEIKKDNIKEDEKIINDNNDVNNNIDTNKEINDIKDINNEIKNVE